MITLTGIEYGEMLSEPVDDSFNSYPLRLTEVYDCNLPERNARSHKFSYGRALIVAGSSDYSGAPAFAANACERSGAGLTRLMVPAGIHAIAAVYLHGLSGDLAKEELGEYSVAPTDGLGQFAAIILPVLLPHGERTPSISYLITIFPIFSVMVRQSGKCMSWMGKCCLSEWDMIKIPHCILRMPEQTTQESIL